MSFSKDGTALADAVTRIATGKGFPLWPVPLDKNKEWLEAVLRDAEIIVAAAKRLLEGLSADP